MQSVLLESLVPRQNLLRQIVTIYRYYWSLWYIRKPAETSFLDGGFESWNIEMSPSEVCRNESRQSLIHMPFWVSSTHDSLWWCFQGRGSHRCRLLLQHSCQWNPLWWFVSCTFRLFLSIVFLSSQILRVCLQQNRKRCRRNGSAVLVQPLTFSPIFFWQDVVPEEKGGFYKPSLWTLRHSQGLLLFCWW